MVICSFNNYLLNAYSMLNAILDTGDESRVKEREGYKSKNILS